jgi:hypothetical protein
VAYVPGKNLTVTVNGNVIEVMTSEIADQAEKIDVSNTKVGVAEFIGGMVETTFNFTMAVNASTYASLVAGTAYTATWAMTGGGSATGSFIMFNKKQSGGAKGAYTITGDGSFTGVVTRA